MSANDRPRLTPDHMDPALCLLLLKLSIDTFVDPFKFANWIRDNLDWLRPSYVESAEPDTDERVENCQGVWLRFQFKERQVSAA